MPDQNNQNPPPDQTYNPVPPVSPPTTMADQPPISPPPDTSTPQDQGLPPVPPQTQDNTQPTPPIQTVEEAAPPSSIPPAMIVKDKSTDGKPKGKIIATILGLLLLVGGVGAGLVLVKTNQDIRQKAAAPEETLPPTTPSAAKSNSEIAKNVISWLDTQKNEEKTYNFVAKYTSTGEKLSTFADRRVGIAVAWARWAYWQKTKDQNILDQLKEDLKTHLNASVVPNIQPNNWTCKLLYEIGNDASLSQDVRTDAKSLCARATYAAVDKVPDEDLAAVSSEFTAKYLWDKKQEDLTSAVTLFEKASSLYQNQRSAGYVTGECVLGISALDLYGATNNAKYLTFATDLFTKDDLTKGTSLNSKLTCGLFANQLNAVSPGKAYQDFVQSEISSIKQNNFDAQLGAFYHLEGQDKAFDTRENSLVVKLLLLGN